MRVVNKKIIVSVIILMVIGMSLLIYKNSSDKGTQLDRVKLKYEEKDNMNMFAIMLEQSDGTYKESTDNTWPTDMQYNKKLSGCIDAFGNTLDNILSYDATNKIAKVKTTSASYCYLYFSYPPDNLYDLCVDYNNIDECVKSSDLGYISDIWNSTLEDDGYRYVGTDPDNYICFGTNNTTECTSDPDKYMYRIIGIFEDESGNHHLKLIKKEALNTAYAWHSDNTTDTDWDGSSLYIGLNGSYYLSNTTEYPYMAETTWTDKIATWNYTAVNTLTYENYLSNTIYGPHYYDTKVSSIYLHELNRSSKSTATCHYTLGDADCNAGEWKTVNGKVSLMYASDYALSLGATALSYNSDSNYSQMNTGWVYISNNDSAPPSGSEWTMSRLGANSNSKYVAHIITTQMRGCQFVDFGGDGVVSASCFAGNLYDTDVTTTYSVRPVFYAITDTILSGGSGTITNPYLIAS